MAPYLTKNVWHFSHTTASLASRLGSGWHRSTRRYTLSEMKPGWFDSRHKVIVRSSAIFGSMPLCTSYTSPRQMIFEGQKITRRCGVNTLEITRILLSQRDVAHWGLCFCLHHCLWHPGCPYQHNRWIVSSISLNLSKCIGNQEVAYFSCGYNPPHRRCRRFYRRRSYRCYYQCRRRRHSYRLR